MVNIWILEFVEMEVKEKVLYDFSGLVGKDFLDYVVVFQGWKIVVFCLLVGIVFGMKIILIFFEIFKLYSVVQKGNIVKFIEVVGVDLDW